MTTPKRRGAPSWFGVLQWKHWRAMKAHGLVNRFACIRAARKVGIPLPVACALLNKESMGKNIYGHDAGGAMSAPFGHNIRVTRKNFMTFRHLVVDLHHTSNGVGPCQITYSGYFPEMTRKGLKAWVPYDNMIEGFGALKAHHAQHGSWQAAATAYNGSGPAAEAYGRDFEHKRVMWAHILDG